MGRVGQGKSTGRKPRLDPEQEDELEIFVCSSEETRQMMYLELAVNFPQWIVGEDAIRNALPGRGFSRRIARNKPPLSVEHRRLRLQWAERHQSLSLNDWCRIIWSDETRINDGPVNKVHVTRREHEEYQNTCIIDRYLKNNSWMFWGCFAGTQAGPFVFLL